MNKEIKRIEDITYLDNTGTSLYFDKQIEIFSKDLISNMYTNPHADPKQKLKILRQEIELNIKEFLSIKNDDYSIIFNNGATSGLKMIAECFVFAEKENNNIIDFKELVYLNDNHTSVVGMRETVLWRKFGFKCLKYDDFMKEANLIRQNDYTNQLFVFPAQSNFNGKKYNLSIINDIKKPKKFVLLDAASFVPCSKLDLEKYQPDFVVFSFYKIFGYPTGLGALIVHKRAKSLLRKRYFGGGTQDIYLVDKKINYPRKNFSSRFEDGTIPFLQLVGLRAAFMCFTMSKFAGLPEKVENVVFTIFSVFLKKLSELKHDNHQPIILIYGDMDHMSSKCNGAVLNFNVLDQNGTLVNYDLVNKSAIKNKIILRTGTFCNIGASQMWLNLTNDDLMKSYEANHVLDDSIGVIDGKPTGSVRISFGKHSTEKDWKNFINFLEKEYKNFNLTII